MSRQRVLDKIKEYEREGKFDVDVEDDPETIPLTPEKVDYLSEKFTTRLFTKIANKKEVMFYESDIKKGNMVIKAVHGIENFTAVKGGAVLTCNHFSVYDNYAVWRAIRDYLPTKQS